MLSPQTIRAAGLLIALTLLLAALGAAGARAQTESRHLTLGNPSGAVSDPNGLDNYLIVRPQYALAHQCERGIPRWVSWHLELADLGDADRYSGQFITDTTLPDGCYRVTHGDYTSSGYDRGHMTPSADRTATDEDNRATFILTNIVPQAPENNRGPWAQLEEYLRGLVRSGGEAYIIAGPVGQQATIAGGRLSVPEAVWKVAVVLPAGDDDLARISAETPVIAVLMPNDSTVQGRPWQSFQTSVRCVEERTGLDLLSTLAAELQAALEGPPCPPAGAPVSVYLPLVAGVSAAVSPPAPEVRIVTIVYD